MSGAFCCFLMNTSIHTFPVAYTKAAKLSSDRRSSLGVVVKSWILSKSASVIMFLKSPCSFIMTNMLFGTSTSKDSSVK